MKFASGNELMEGGLCLNYTVWRVLVKKAEWMAEFLLSKKENNVINFNIWAEIRLIAKLYCASFCENEGNIIEMFYQIFLFSKELFNYL